jgi:tripartite-type tricarboxylate transporter receptor subunit TctC
MDRRTLLATLASGAAAAAAPFARAQGYPSQLIRWVVPYPAGGAPT